MFKKSIALNAGKISQCYDVEKDAGKFSKCCDVEKGCWKNAGNRVFYHLPGTVEVFVFVSALGHFLKL